MRESIDFFIVGAQKAGTTALHHLLRKQPSIQLPGIKELHHFDDEGNVDWSDPDHGGLHRFFDWDRQGVIRGEATPAYIFWPGALERIQRYNARAKLIVGLRHPAFRAHSQWRMNVSRGLETLSFEEAISQKGRDRIRDGSFSSLRNYSYIERGFYAKQISSALELFPREQLHFYRTDSLWIDPTGTIREIARFLGFEAVEDTQLGYTSPYERSDPKTLAPEDRENIEALFKDDVREAGTLTGMDLSDWESPDYAEPMRMPARL
jgi:hypothetical protein